MLRKLVAILLIFSTLGLLVRFSVPYLWYYSNYQYIASELCINRHNPDIDCNGSCQLKKMVKHHAGDHDSNKKKPALPNDSRPYISLYYQQAAIFSFSEKNSDQLFSSILSLLKTQFIKTPPTPPPMSLV